jgi:hypothetical protein
LDATIFLEREGEREMKRKLALKERGKKRFFGEN